MLRNRGLTSTSTLSIKRLWPTGHLSEALEISEQGRTSTSTNYYASVLQVCRKEKDITVGRLVLSLITRNGFELDEALGSLFIRMFSSCSCLQEAQWVFSKLCNPDIFAWTAIIHANAKLGHCENAIALYHQMQQSGISPDQHIFVSVLKACATLPSLSQGMLVHKLVVGNSLDSDTYIGNSLIDLYFKCDRKDDAINVFSALPNPSVVTWTMMILGLSEHEYGWEALHLFFKMQIQTQVQLDDVIFVSVLKVCAVLTAPDYGMLIHALVMENGHDVSLAVNNTLIDMYAKCRHLDDALQVFGNIKKRSTVTWNIMISAYSHQKGHDREVFDLFQAMRQNNIPSTLLTWNSVIAGLIQQGQSNKALDLFNEMLATAITADSAIFVSVLKGCSNIEDLRLGRTVHAQISEVFHEVETSVTNSLIDMYGKCGSLADALSVFCKSKDRNVVTWTTIIGRFVQRQQYAEALQLFKEMEEVGVYPNYVTFLVMLKGSNYHASLKWGMTVHDQVLRLSCEKDILIGNTLIDMYSKSGTIDNAHCIFQEMPKESVITWTTMITGYVQNGHIPIASKLFKQMQHFGIQANVVTWNAMLAGCAEHGFYEQAFQWFSEMLNSGVKPDEATFISILKSCINVNKLNMGKQIHSLIIEDGFDCHEYVGNTLVDMYGKCGSIFHARKVFDHLPKQDVVTWNAMIGGYCQYENGQETFRFLNKFVQEGMLPNQGTFVSALTACSNMLASNQGKLIHNLMVESNFTCDAVVGNALIDMYVKCGNIRDALSVFDELPYRNVITWSSIVAGHAQQNNFPSAFDTFEKIQHEGLKPDDATFVSLLSVCRQMGFVHEGCKIFLSMVDVYDVKPKPDHFNCMVALLANAGCWNEAEDLLKTMPYEPDIKGWTTLISNCKSHGNIQFGERCLTQVIEMDNRDAVGPQLMSSVYADAGMSRNACQLADCRKFSNSWKLPGKSFIEVGDMTHSFLVGDRDHSQSEAIFAKLRTLLLQMKGEGYTPQANLVIQSSID